MKPAFFVNFLSKDKHFGPITIDTQNMKLLVCTKLSNLFYQTRIVFYGAHGIHCVLGSFRSWCTLLSEEFCVYMVPRDQRFRPEPKEVPCKRPLSILVGLMLEQQQSMSIKSSAFQKNVMFLPITIKYTLNVQYKLIFRRILKY